MVTIQHFVFVRSTSSLLRPSSDCVQNWNRPFSPPLSPPPYTTTTSTFSLSFLFFFLNLSYSLLLTPFAYFSHIFFQLFFLWSAPSFTPSHTVGYTHTGSHTNFHPNYILPFVYRQEPFVSWNTQPGLLLHKFLQLPSCIRTHTALQVQYMTGGGLPGWYCGQMDQHKAFKGYYWSLSTCMQKEAL